jgi:hypothetical protein
VIKFYFILFLFSFSLLILFSICTAQLQQQQPDSPRLGDCVCVLLFDDKPAGTAFYVGNNKFLTAAHNLLEDDGTVADGKFSVTLRVEWSPDFTTMTSYNPLIVVHHAHEQTDDWAVLESVAPVVGWTAIEICPENEIPPMNEVPQFKLYYCPAMRFQLKRIQVLEASAFSWNSPVSIERQYGAIYFPYGTSKGSSGGVIINRSGQAVAMHLESENDILTSDEVKSESAHSGKDEISISADSAANSHCSTARALILSHFPDLMNAIS